MTITGVLRREVVNAGILSADRIVSTWIPADKRTYPIVLFAELSAEQPKIFLDAASTDIFISIGVAVISNKPDASTKTHGIQKEIKAVLDGITGKTLDTIFVGSVRRIAPPLFTPGETDDAADVHFYENTAVYDIEYEEVAS